MYESVEIDRLGAYRLLERIGVGAMGTVFLAPTPMLREIAAQTADGLAAIHGAGIVPPGGTSPTQGAVRNELKEGIREAVERLPEPDRTVVRLHTFGGLGFREVAEQAGLADKNAARWVFQRALKKLGEEMDGGG